MFATGEAQPRLAGCRAGDDSAAVGRLQPKAGRCRCLRALGGAAG
eukprot:CAMPEP_0203908668 /NCGR_PEP_ID=MMETSP0359-20131031/50066_1 /ASSEMBLY_ACC=CAM_ASM_000338 /TAXON_ID=268821 /ORGANISM="Scrippsiella Hangoei, Strain SHTV-5" /LENGTH=44 /DNA_ID= /DNA_START= /DNA_END= /DNA_ORIENTATION=